MGDRRSGSLDNRRQSDGIPHRKTNINEEIKIQSQMNRQNAPKKVDKKSSNLRPNAVPGKISNLPTRNTAISRLILSSDAPHKPNPGPSIESALIPPARPTIPVRKPEVRQPPDYRPEIARLHEKILKNNSVTLT